MRIVLNYKNFPTHERKENKNSNYANYCILQVKNMCLINKSQYVQGRYKVKHNIKRIKKKNCLKTILTINFFPLHADFMQKL